MQFHPNPFLTYYYSTIVSVGTSTYVSEYTYGGYGNSTYPTGQFYGASNNTNATYPTAAAPLRSGSGAPLRLARATPYQSAPVASSSVASTSDATAEVASSSSTGLTTVTLAGKNVKPAAAAGVAKDVQLRDVASTSVPTVSSADAANSNTVGIACFFGLFSWLLMAL
ncbi:unnamed protein product [Ambrosiozyma monospora]|uniref:Unnamed protein product n=1 Tax=Ambrosiozyma monospora TaxID=43982 RepID=A0ACB5SXY6_AMBMO|nr:unnamed protein product [Ambrosiozyma monospora]